MRTLANGHTYKVCTRVGPDGERISLRFVFLASVKDMKPSSRDEEMDL